MRSIYGDEIRVRALYDYSPADDDEIGVKKGEILEQLKKADDNGGAVGRLADGSEGVYPARYVELI